MSNSDHKPFGKDEPITSKEELEDVLRKISSQEQVYTIALFDILGFSNFVEKNGTDIILELYNKLLDLISKQQSGIGDNSGPTINAVPIRMTEDWKHNLMVAGNNGYVNVCHFSDTFILYVNYHLHNRGFWLANRKDEPYPLLLGEVGTPYYPIMYAKHYIYLSFLQTCMEFFCEAIVAGIPLRGCISTGPAVMDSYKSIYIGSTLVEAARGETEQNSLGIAFGKSFNNCHPVYNDYFIPYLSHIKENSSFLSPMMLDWARYWQKSPTFNKHNLVECINKMNTDARFSSYYDNAIKFFEFSNNHQNWSHELNREGITDITDYYKRAVDWYNSVK